MGYINGKGNFSSSSPPYERAGIGVSGSRFYLKQFFYIFEISCDTLPM